MSSLAAVSVRKWQYSDIAARAREAEEGARIAALPSVSPGFSEEEVNARVQEALARAEVRWTAQADAEREAQQARMCAALETFAAERTDYFRRVETEVVHLSLAIARKILGREAELDPTLLSGLVRIALDRMGAGSAIRLRVAPGDLAGWQRKNAFGDGRYVCELLPDAALGPGACCVETDLGAADFGFETQMQEIETGLLNILAQRPETA